MKQHEGMEAGAKTVVVTGATSGIGLAAARRLAELRWRVIGVGRSEARCDEAQASVRSRAPGAAIDYLVADLGSQRQVRELAAQIRGILEGENGGRLDVLLNNAGTVSRWYVATEDGYERQFAVNYLAPFLLTLELLPALRRGESARVITTSSGSHFRTRMRWKDLMLRRRYNPLLAYKQSKLAEVLFTNELNHRLGPDSTIRAYAVDPGLVDTSIGEKGTSGLVRWVWRQRRRGGISPDEAAKTLVHLAAEPVLQYPLAGYWKECRPAASSPYAERDDARRRLWEVSERLCGIHEASEGVVA